MREEKKRFKGSNLYCETSHIPREEDKRYIAREKEKNQ